MEMPIGRIGDNRACGAVIINPMQSSVYTDSMRLVAVLGSLDSHGGIAITAATSVFIESKPVLKLRTINDVCRWVQPPHYLQPLVIGDYNVFAE